MTTKNCFPWWSHRSAPIFFHALSVRGVVINGSFLWLGRFSWQKSQFETLLWMSRLMPGRQTNVLALLRHLVTPWWPSWISSNISGCSVGGITRRFLINDLAIHYRETTTDSMIRTELFRDILSIRWPTIYCIVKNMTQLRITRDGRFDALHLRHWYWSHHFSCIHINFDIFFCVRSLRRVWEGISRHKFLSWYVFSLWLKCQYKERRKNIYFVNYLLAA